MDKTVFLDEYFFKGDKYTLEGEEFLDKINNYRKNVVDILGPKSSLVPTVNKRFSTENQTNKDGK